MYSHPPKLAVLSLLTSTTVLAAPWQKSEPHSFSHPGWSSPSVISPPQPAPSLHHSKFPWPIANSTAIFPTGSGTGSYSTIYSTDTVTSTATSQIAITLAPPTARPSPTSITSGTPGSNLSPGDAACASVKELIASQTSASPKATPTISAEIAYECLNAVPFNQSAAADLLESMRPYLQWQTTIEYLKDPPTEYAEKIQAPYDFWNVFEGIVAKVNAGAYASEYAFGFDLYEATQKTHDGHFAFVPDSVVGVFSFGRKTPLVSVSEDGTSLPVIYAYADILTASFGNATFTPSPITHIDGRNVTEYLLEWSQYGSLQDRDALWNNLFYIPAQVSLGTSGTGTGTFSGGGRGRYVYPGATTTFDFANGTSATNENFARVLQDFTNITTGADVYQQFFAVGPEAYQDALQLATSTTSTTTSPTTNATSSTSTAVKTTPAPGYPSPVVKQTNNLNSGYFIPEAGYDDVAVLVVPSFVSLDTAEVEFQNVNSELIAAALAANKTKLIIDVSANGGGTILQGYDLFKQLFPSILPYGATRFRAHEAFDVLGQEYSEISGHYPRSLAENDTVRGILSSAWNYRTDVDVNYENFNSWDEKYGPHEFGPYHDTFTSIIRWNLSDVLTTDNSGGIVISGYGNRTNVTTQPFAAEDIIIVYDGYCASTCTIFSELMRQQAGVKTVALGGRPNYDIIQAVGGVKGTNDFPWSYILDSIEGAFSFANETHREYLNDSTPFGYYNQLPLYRSASGPVVNSRDGIRQGDTSETPLQFVYEPADCRIFYTPEMVVDQEAVWKSVADSVWGDVNHCVAGSDQFYGRSKRSVGVQGQRHKVRRDMNFAEHWEGLGVSTGEGLTLGGDAIMYP